MAGLQLDTAVLYKASNFLNVPDNKAGYPKDRPLKREHNRNKTLYPLKNITIPNFSAPEHLKTAGLTPVKKLIKALLSLLKKRSPLVRMSTQSISCFLFYKAFNNLTKALFRSVLSLLFFTGTSIKS